MPATNSSVQYRDVELAYIAGLIDGEGHIGIHGRPEYRRKPSVAGYVLRLAVAMTDETTVRWLRQTTGLGNVTRSEPRDTQRRPNWQWRVTGKKAAWFLELLLPYLRLKRPHADVAIRFAATIGQRNLAENRRKYLAPNVAAIRVECVEAIRSLNINRRQKTILPITRHNVPPDLKVPY